MDLNIRLDQLYEDVINLGYTGEAGQKDIFIKVFGGGPPNYLFANITAWLSAQLACCCDLESKITPFDGTEELDIGFMVELSSLLKELNCPIKRITTGSIEERLMQPEDKVNTLMFLCTELQAAKMIYSKKPKKETQMKIELDESRTAKELKEMLIALNFGKPPSTITPQQLFGEVEKKIKQLSHPTSPKEFVGEHLFSGCLTEKQWFQIDNLYKELFKEYKIRRDLLLTRLDVTIQSFEWADRLKDKVNEIKSLYEKIKVNLSDQPNVKISDILAASSDLLIIEKTSSAAVRKNTKSSVNKVKIGPVPDRGGRPEEQQPPPPEVPSWQKNDSSSRGGGFGGQSGGQRHNDSYRQNDRQNQDSYNRQGGRPRQGEDSRYSERQRQDYSRQNDNRGGQYQNRSNDRFKENQPYNQGGGYQQSQQGGYQQTQSGYQQSQQGGYQQKPVYNDARVDYSPMYSPQPVIINPIPGGFGFGGYGPASDNFAQFGGVSQSSQPSSGDGYNRPRGNRGGGRGSRPYRGSGRGGNRY